MLIEEAPPVTEAELDRMVKRKLSELPRLTGKRLEAARARKKARVQKPILPLDK